MVGILLSGLNGPKIWQKWKNGGDRIAFFFSPGPENQCGRRTKNRKINHCALRFKVQANSPKLWARALASVPDLDRCTLCKRTTSLFVCLFCFQTLLGPHLPSWLPLASCTQLARKTTATLFLLGLQSNSLALVPARNLACSTPGTASCQRDIMWQMTQCWHCAISPMTKTIHTCARLLIHRSPRQAGPASQQLLSMSSVRHSSFNGRAWKWAFDFQPSPQLTQKNECEHKIRQTNFSMSPKCNRSTGTRQKLCGAGRWYCAAVV